MAPADGDVTKSHTNQLPLTQSVPTDLADFATDLLALSQIRGLGRSALLALSDAYKPLYSVWDAHEAALEDILHRARVPRAQDVARHIVANSLQWRHAGAQERMRLEQAGYTLISSDDPQFPNQLRRIKDSPRWLFYEGNVEIFNAPALVAVVGMRKASRQGCEVAKHVTRLVVNQGLGIVSGLAEGIDACAHTVAADAGAPQVAILGTGITVMFPQENRGLRDHIIDNGGAVLTEYLPYERSGKANFVRRNRLQVAMAQAVCPAEATTSGGTSHTVTFAREAGTPVFGVTRQGRPYPPLIKETDKKFDISTPEGRKNLAEFLDALPGPRAPRPKPIDMHVWINNFVSQIHRMRSYYDISEHDQQAILNRVAQALDISYKAPREDDGRQSGDS